MQHGASCSARAVALSAVVVFGLAACVYLNTLYAEFTLDDVPIIVENELIADLTNIPRYFTTNYWGDSAKFTDKSLYRPLVIISYALNYAMHGLKPWGYHAVNVVLHAAACVLLLFLVLRLSGDLVLACIAAVLFAVHPIHTEVVAGVVGRAEIMALVGTLACCLAYAAATESTLLDQRLLTTGGQQGGAGNARGPRRGLPFGASSILIAAAVLAYAFGCFSKEIGIVAPALIILWELILPSRRALLRLDPRAVAAFAGFLVTAIVFVFMRQGAVKSVSINVGFVGVTDQERVWTALRVCFEYVLLLVAPVRLSADYWVTDVPIARSAAEPGVVAAAACLAAFIAGIVWSWRRYPFIAWGLAVFLVVLFPVSNLPMPIGVMKAERLLYSPSAGFMVAAAAMMTAALHRPKLRPACWTLLVFVVIATSVRTWVRNYDWRDNRTLAEVTLRTSPDSVIFNTIMATCYREKGDNIRARPHLERALAGQPDNTTSLFNLGNIELDEKNFDRAVELYRRTLAVKPEYISALNNLGRALSEAGRLDEAVAPLEKSRRLRPDSPASYVNLLSIYIQTRNLETGVPFAEEALRRFPNVAAVHWNAGSILGLAGRKDEATAIHEKARRLEGGDAQNEIRESLD